MDINVVIALFVLYPLYLELPDLYPEQAFLPFVFGYLYPEHFFLIIYL